MMLGNGTTRAYAYDANSRLTTQIELNGATPLVTIVDSYDPVGNRIGRNLDGVVTTWTYDDLYRLTHQNKPGQVCTYVLDPVGNLEVMWEATANPKTFTFDAADRLVTMVEGTNTTTYTYTGYGALEVTVDSRGTRTTNTYDGQDQLIKVQRGGGGVVGTTSTYTFDGDGMRRTAQEGNVAPTTMVWDGSDYLFLDGPSSDQLVLTLDGEIVACGSKDLLTDPLGSLVREITAGATLSGQFNLYPYGRLVAGSPTPATPWVYVAAYGIYRDTSERVLAFGNELSLLLGRPYQSGNLGGKNDNPWGLPKPPTAGDLLPAPPFGPPLPPTPYGGPAKCRVYRCNGPAENWLHGFVCVEHSGMSTGGCCGSLYWDGWSSCNFHTGPGGCAGAEKLRCKLVSTDCSYASGVCACMSESALASPSGPASLEWFLGGFCWGHVHRVLCCACAATFYHSVNAGAGIGGSYLDYLKCWFRCQGDRVLPILDGPNPSVGGSSGGGGGSTLYGSSSMRI